MNTRGRNTICLAGILVMSLLYPPGAGASEIPPPAQPATGLNVFSVFSTQTLEQGRFSIGGVLEVVAEPDITHASLILGYGITDDLEVSGAFPYTASDDHEGVSDLAVSAKYRVFHEGRYGPAMAVILGVNLPTGGGRAVGRSDAFDVQGLVVGTKRLGPFTGHVNLGYTVVGTTGYEDEVTASLGLEFSASRRLNILGEFYSRTSRVPDTSDILEWRIGYRLTAPGNIISTVGLGFTMGSRAPDYRVFVGLSWLLPIRSVSSSE